MTIPQRRILVSGAGLGDVPELTNDALEAARWNPGVGCVIDRIYPASPLLISFGFVDWQQLPLFDFFGRTKKLEQRSGRRFNRILVRDIENAWYHRAIPGLGAQVEEVASSLRGLTQSIRPSHVITIGQSMGAYAAIMLGMLVNAHRIVAFGPLSHLEPAEAIRFGDRRFLAVMEQLQADPPDYRYTVLNDLARALDYRGELHVVFGTHPGIDDGVSGNLDAIHALRLARLPKVFLYPYPESQHPVMQWLIDHRQIDELLSKLLEVDDGNEIRRLAPIANVAGSTESGSNPGSGAGIRESQVALPAAEGHSRIAEAVPGYLVHDAGRHFPLVLAFGGRKAPPGEFTHSALLDRIARQYDRPLGSILLQDHAGAGYYQGVSGLGGSIDDVLAALQPIIDRLAPSEIVTFGEGLGGHAALVYGVLLGARRIVAVEPPAHLVDDVLVRYNDRRWQRELASLPDLATARRFEVPSLMARIGFQGRASILLGTARENEHHDAVHLNAIHAHWLALSDRVTLCPFPQAGSNLLDRLVERCDAERVLLPYFFEDTPSSALPRVSLSPGPPALWANQRVFFQPKITICHSPPKEGGKATELPWAYAVAGEVDPIATRKVTDEWRRWIAENLMLGASPENARDAMVATGISVAEATREVDLAVHSPYVRGSALLLNRLKKRDWLLATYRKLNRLNPHSRAIERRHRLPRTKFLEDYYSTNRPVIITGMMDDWPAMRKWNLDYFAQQFGDREVEVQFGRSAGDTYEIEREKSLTRLRFADYIAQVRAAGVTNDFTMTASNNSSNKQTLASLWNDIVQVPEYLDGRDPLNGFFWMGPAGTITPFHHDLTNNFMAQVIGRKRVKIAPSWDIPLMDNHFHVYSRVDGRITPPRPQPRPGEAQIVECILNPGEILFLPIGCLHFVEGIDISVTVSFTNFVFDNDFSTFYTTYHAV